MLAAFLAAVFFALSAIFAHRTTRLVGCSRRISRGSGWPGRCSRLWAHGFGRGLHGAGLPVFVLSGMVGFGMGDLALFAALPLLGFAADGVDGAMPRRADGRADRMALARHAARRASNCCCGAVILLGVGIARRAGETRRRGCDRQPTVRRSTGTAGLLFGVARGAGAGRGSGDQPQGVMPSPSRRPGRWTAAPPRTSAPSAVWWS